VSLRKSSVACVVIAVAVLGGACKSQNDVDEQKKKVAELQAQLDDAKQQLAAKQEASKAAEPSASDTAATPPDASAGTAAPGNAPKAQGRTTPDQSAASGKSLVEQPRGLDNREATSQPSDVARRIDDSKPVEYTIPAGMVIAVRTTSQVSTSSAATGSPFSGVLERALVVDGAVLAAQGAHVDGTVVSSDPGGRVKGVASLDVTIRSIGGPKNQTIRVRTNTHRVVAAKSTGRDAKRTGIMTGAGAIVGAIAGGGKGAAIGAGAGAATGVGTTMATRGKAAVIPAETLINFRLSAPVTVVSER
jgi:outer membrane murein-binding lipoprotein Lpp